jgi:hypothetical protein
MMENKKLRAVAEKKKKAINENSIELKARRPTEIDE